MNQGPCRLAEQKKERSLKKGGGKTHQEKRQGEDNHRKVSFKTEKEGGYPYQTRKKKGGVIKAF